MLGTVNGGSGQDWITKKIPFSIIEHEMYIFVTMIVEQMIER